MAWILVVVFLLPAVSVEAIVIEDFPSQSDCAQAGEQIVRDLGPRLTVASFSCITRGQ